MSDFRTILETKPSTQKINLDHRIFTMGSCFADNLGNMLSSHKFNVRVNPFGTCYNPVSIHRQLDYTIHNSTPASDTYGVLNDTHFNYDFHSSFSTLERNNTEQNIIAAIQKSHEFIKSADVLMITYGTAWIYHRKDNDAIVANCHKVSGSQFTKQLLTQKKMLESFKSTYEQLQSLNPDIRIILTLSPVRHIRDTLELNSVSKSVLRLSCYTLSSLYPNVEYFPAFELMMDDLRDYRFYSRDMLHPTPEATEYIWNNFRRTYFDNQIQKFVTEWGEIMKSLDHRSFLPKGILHQQFLKQLLTRIEELKTKVNVDKEVQQIKSQLTS